MLLGVRARVARRVPAGARLVQLGMSLLAGHPVRYRYVESVLALLALLVRQIRRYGGGLPEAPV